jgi:hypothetical protein
MTPESLLTKAVPQDVKTLDSTTTDNETRSCLRVQAIFNQAPIACKGYSTGDRGKIPPGWKVRSGAPRVPERFHNPPLDGFRSAPDFRYPKKNISSLVLKNEMKRYKWKQFDGPVTPESYQDVNEEIFRCSVEIF